MMHHPSSQFGSNLKTTEPDTNNSYQYSQNQDPNDSTFSPKGNVAALRNVIHGQLDMKTPSGKTHDNSRYQKPAPPPVDPTPAWAKNVKVYEPNGYVDPHLNKHNMGRVLDGPVNPNKFFQGVPPPSYSQVKLGIDSKPPAPPSKPISQAQALQAQVLQNETFSSKPPSDPYRAPPIKPTNSYRIPYDVALDPRHHPEFDIDDSASIISSSCTFGESSEIAAFSAAAEQRHLYEQYKRKLLEEKMMEELKEDSETPAVSISENEVPRSIFETDLIPFGHVTTAPVTTAPPIATVPPQKPADLSFKYSPPQQSPSSDKQRSLDLESSQLLVKPKSPAPYSTSSSDHYGTIRRKHKPVAIEISPKISPKLSPSDKISPKFFGNGFEEKQKDRTPVKLYPDVGFGNSESLNESLNQAFEIASSIESAKNNYEAPHTTPKSLTSGGDRSISDTYPVSSVVSSPPMDPTTTQTNKEPETMSNSMSTNMDDSIIIHKHESPDSSPDRNEDMSQWYRKMFKQMHKKGDEEQPKTASEFERFADTTPTGNLRRSQESLHQQNHRTTPSVSPKSPHHDSQISGSFVEHGVPSSSTTPPQTTSALQTTTNRKYIARPPHFHLPTYRFRDEDPRPHRCTFNNCLLKNNKYGTPCMMCDRPRKDIEFKDVDVIYENMKKMKEEKRQRSQNSLDLIRITNNLDETTRSLNQFLQQIDATWKRSKSQPTMRLTKGMSLMCVRGPSDPQNYQVGLKSNEDELLRLKAEKLAEELKKEKDRKHSFIPSATPSLQNNMDRLNSLLYDFSNEAPEQNYSQHQNQNPVVTATAVYKFEPRSARELPLNRGDIIRIIRDVDAYWMEGERNGRCGIFPNSYVQINSGSQSDSQKMRAIYPFTARSDTELSLKRGEIVTRRRQIDSNWLEGSNQIGIVGIFPASYVESLETHAPEPPMAQGVFPNRPKTPKIEDQYQSYSNPRGGMEQQYQPQQSYQSERYQPYQPQQQVHQQQPPVATVVPNNKVRFDLPSGSETSLQISYGMKRIEYEPPHEEPILEQYRKPNDEPKPTTTTIPTKKDNNILMNAASLIPKGSEMYRAVYPYQPQKDDELQLYTNDIIFVVEKCDDGWYIGTSLRTGEFGIFPGNYVKRH
ncbi:Protein CBR-SORB-1 [Caenorhabditis briggsae]|uniref:Protein CBR-SORB-1 n=1 Tax=Caenorhabditis briggsae TaxID=6238 RepID=A8Y232_CAEBR|nr:Protein CBR-SORB-1 [Caenorhabditis briggsae]CAP38972.2 Protein CBR-SORB-1 [Caenorhabditis briggsae]